MINRWALLAFMLTVNSTVTAFMVRELVIGSKNQTSFWLGVVIFGGVLFFLWKAGIDAVRGRFNFYRKYGE